MRRMCECNSWFFLRIEPRRAADAGLHFKIEPAAASTGRTQATRICSGGASRSATSFTALEMCTPARTSLTCLVGSGSTVLIPNIAAAALSRRSAIRTGMDVSSRKSRRGCPVASTPLRRPLHRRMIWRVRFGGLRQLTASTRNAPGDATRTGQIGTPPTWLRNGRAVSRPLRRQESDGAGRGALASAASAFRPNVS
jgi:hypothetical protein